MIIKEILIFIGPANPENDNKLVACYYLIYKLFSNQRTGPANDASRFNAATRSVAEMSGLCKA